MLMAATWYAPNAVKCCLPKASERDNRSLSPPFSYSLARIGLSRTTLTLSCSGHLWWTTCLVNDAASPSSLSLGVTDSGSSSNSVGTLVTNACSPTLGAFTGRLPVCQRCLQTAHGARLVRATELHGPINSHNLLRSTSITQPSLRSPPGTVICVLCTGPVRPSALPTPNPLHGIPTSLALDPYRR